MHKFHLFCFHVWWSISETQQTVLEIEHNIFKTQVNTTQNYRNATNICQYNIIFICQTQRNICETQHKIIETQQEILADCSGKPRFKSMKMRCVRIVRYGNR